MTHTLLVVDSLEYQIKLCAQQYSLLQYSDHTHAEKKSVQACTEMIMYISVACAILGHSRTIFIYALFTANALFLICLIYTLSPTGMGESTGCKELLGVTQNYLTHSNLTWTMGNYQDLLL